MKPAGIRRSRVSGRWNWMGTSRETKAIKRFLFANGLLCSTATEEEAVRWWKTNVKPLLGKGLSA